MVSLNLSNYCLVLMGIAIQQNSVGKPLLLPVHQAYLMKPLIQHIQPPKGPNILVICKIFSRHVITAKITIAMFLIRVSCLSHPKREFRSGLDHI